MSHFAKLYEPEPGRQIVVMKDSSEQGEPALAFYFVPEGLGVCRVNLGYSDDEEGWDKLDAAFDKVTLETAVKTIDAILEGLT